VAGLPDGRDPGRSVYPKQLLVWSGILIPLLGLGSRRQFRFEADTAASPAKLNALAHAHCETAPHSGLLLPNPSCHSAGLMVPCTTSLSRRLAV